MADFIRSCKGAEVKVTISDGKTYTGQILLVEDKPVTTQAGTNTLTFVTILSQEGLLSVFELAKMVCIQFVDPYLQGHLALFLKKKFSSRKPFVESSGLTTMVIEVRGLFELSKDRMAYEI